MSLEAGIHTKYGGYKPLTSLVPSYKFHTGIAPHVIKGYNETTGEPILGLSVDPPFVILENQGITEDIRTSSGTQNQLVAMQFQVFHENLDTGKEIVTLLIGLFNRCEFNFPGGTAKDCKPARGAQVKDITGVWRLEVNAPFRILA